MNRKWPLLKVLTDDEVEQIHSASLEILDRTGVLVHEESVLERLHEIGARVDFKKHLVRYPPELVQASVEKAPSSFTWYGRDPEKNMHMGAGNAYFAAGAMARTVMDADGHRRPATCQDADNIGRILDALEYAHEGSAVVLPQDVPPESAHAHNMFYTVKNSTKPYRGRCWGRQQAQDSIEMAAVVAGGREALRRRPVMGTIIGIVSPLTHDRETLEAMVEYARLGLPIILGGMTQVGATGPITIAGTIALHNAEILSGVVNTQAINPGTPVMYGSVSGIFDMRTCTYSYGAIEDALFQVGFAQLAHFYQLPTRADCGQTDSKVLDMQAGFEGVQATLLAALSGHDFLYGAVLGSVESTGTYSYEKMLIQHEIAGGISRLLKGITIDRDMLAVDLIDKVGPGGHYFDQAHTMKYLRVEQFIPALASRKGHWRWMQEGGPTMTERAREAVEHILETHYVQPLDEYVQRELKRIMKSIEAREEPPG